MQADRFQLGGHVGVVTRWWDWFFLYMFVCDCYWGLACEWWAGGDHLVEHDGQRVHVASWISRLALSLFGRKIGGCTHDRTGLGQIVGRRSGNGACDAEVGHLDLAGIVDQYVAGLDVAMYDSIAVGERQRCSYVAGDVSGSVGV